MKRLLLSSALLIAGCSNGDIAGGTGTETTNGIVVITSAGVPASNGTVYSIDPTRWYSNSSEGVSPVEDSVVIPENGVLFSGGVPENRTLQIRWNDESAVVTEQRDTVFLTPGKTVRGVAPTGSRILIGGTAFQAEISGDSFEIAGVPDGTYSLWIDQSGLKAVEQRISIDDSTEIDTLPLSENLLFEDFAQGFTNNPLSSISTGVQWYMVTDRESKVFKDGLWNESIHNTEGSSTISASETDDAVYIDGYLGTGADAPYLCLGVSLFGKDFQTGYNLESMDSVHLKIRGNGVLDVALETALIDSVGVSHYRAEISLNSSWSEIAVPVSDLKLLEKDASYESIYPWSSCANNVKRLEFLWRAPNNSVPGNYWMEIDEIRFGNVTFPF